MSYTTAIFGSTGLTGKNILATVANLDCFSQIHTISRRKPFTESAKLNAQIEADTDKWAPSIAAITPTPDVVFSAVGTTRAAAGGIQNQWKIDHDLNIELAKSAKAAGVKTYVFISSAGTRGLLASAAPYSKMKVGVEDTIQSLEFETCAIVLRPGAILGQREGMRTTESWLNATIDNLGKLRSGFRDGLGQDATVIARAAAAAAKQAAEGKAPEKFWVLEQADILKLGRDEWKE